VSDGAVCAAAVFKLVRKITSRKNVLVITLPLFGRFER
jgi:hypothetical protein